MFFSDKLKKLMNELDLTQTAVSNLTGIGKSSLSQYLSGKHEPSRERKREIALALGVQEDYFDMFLPTARVEQNEVVNIPPELAARLMKKSAAFIKQGLKDGVFPWGYAVKMGKWNYWISSVKFTEYTGIEVPVKEKY